MQPAIEIQQRPRLYWVLSDTWELFRRSAIQIGRTPGQLITVVILQPVLLIILFNTYSAARSTPATPATQTS